MDLEFTKRLERIKYLKQILQELKSAEQHNLTLHDVVNNYSRELQNINDHKALAQAMPIPNPPSKNIQQIKTGLSNWYKENNILFLLYLGAVLMVLSALIFVGFNWEQIPGEAKTLIMAAASSLFASAGMFLYLKSKSLKIAGEVFTAIGAISAPLIGLAYYNFVSKNTPDKTALITSLILLVVYFGIGRLLDKKLYAYLGSLMVLILICSARSVFGFEVVSHSRSYSIITAAIILRFLSNYYDKQEQKKAYSLASDVVMVLGILRSSYDIHIEYNSFGTLPAALLAALVSLYYILSFKYKELHEYIFASIIFSYLALASFSNYYTSMQTMLYVLVTYSLAFAFFDELLPKKVRVQSILANTLATAPILLFAYYLSQTREIANTDMALISLMISFRSIYIFLSQKTDELLVYGNATFVVSIAYALKLVPITNRIEIFGLVALIIGLVNFYIFTQKRHLDIFMYVSMGLCGLAFFSTIQSDIYNTIVSLIVAIVFYVASTSKGEEGYSYVALGFLGIASWRLFNVLNFNFDSKRFGTSLILTSVITEKVIKKVHIMEF